MKPYYEADGITIYHGDCRDIPVPCMMADVLLTDPPYSRAGASSSGITSVAGRAGAIAESDQFWLAWFTEVMTRVTAALSSSGMAFIFNDYRTIASVERAVAATRSGWNVSQCLVWNRMSMGLGSPFRASYELIAFARGPEFCHTGSRDVRNVFDSRWPYGSHEHHPAEKPVGLLRDLLCAFGSVPRCVLDPFCGSGSSLVAAQRLGLSAIGIEIEERYCEIAAKRLAQGVLDFGGAA